MGHTLRTPSGGAGRTLSGGARSVTQQPLKESGRFRVKTLIAAKNVQWKSCMQALRQSDQCDAELKGQDDE